MTDPRVRPTRHDGGFTLIELIVAIIVIGILAAIAVPTYLGQQRSARDAAVVSDVRNSSTLMSNWVLDNPRTAIVSTPDLVSAGGKTVQGTSTVIDVTANGRGGYTVCGYAAGAGTYSSNSSAYLVDSVTSTAGRTTAGCPGDGVPAPASTPAPSTGTGSTGGTSTGGTSTGGTSTGGTSTGGTTPTPSASASSPAPSSTPTPSATSTPWIDCAGENGTCSFTGTHVVRYGAAPSSYVIKTFTNGTPCTNAVFGDPAVGTVKSCSYQN